MTQPSHAVRVIGCLATVAIFFAGVSFGSALVLLLN